MNTEPGPPFTAPVSTNDSAVALRERAAPFPARSSPHDLALVVLVGAIAFLVRVIPPLVRGGLLASYANYDDGVYFGAALAMVHGLIPYRDFLLLHPPGILVFLSPLAAVSGAFGDAGAFTVARLAFPLVGACNAALVVALGGRVGRRVGLLAGLTYAVIPVAVSVERTTWLIAPQVTFLLLTLLALDVVGYAGAREPSRRRAVLGGAAIGMAFSIQIWNAVPALLLLGWVMLRARRAGVPWWRPAMAYVLAATAVVAVVWGPFLAVAGPTMLRYVILDQAHRVGTAGSLIKSVEALVGVRTPGATPGSPLIVILSIVAAATILAAGAWVAWRRRELRPLALIAAVQIVVILRAPPYGHYAGWVAPLVAVIMAAAVEAVWVRPRIGTRARSVIGLGVTGALVVLLGASSLKGAQKPLDLAALDAATADAVCLAADAPIVLIEMNRLSTQVEAGCRFLADPSGAALDVGRGCGVKVTACLEYQAAMRAYYTAGDGALFIRSTGLNAATTAAIRAAFPVTTKIGPVTVRTTR